MMAADSADTAEVSEELSESEAGSEEPAAVCSSRSLIDRLKCPPRSDLSRKRKVEKSLQANKKHKVGATNRSDPVSVSPSARVKEFPGEYLTVRNGKLFCAACREELALKKSTIKTHIETGTKRQNSKRKLEAKKAKERDLTDLLQTYDKEVQPAGRQVSMEERVYRAKVVEQFLKAGIPLRKIDSLRELLEENAFRLTHSSHLSNYIAPLHLQEKQTVRELISGRDVSLIFDGTSRLGEALAIVIRFCVGWSIKQKLVRLSMLAKSLSGEEIAREILTVLSTQLGIPSGNLLAIMRDRASVNNVAVSSIAILYPSAIDIGCFSHTLSHVGEKFNVPILAKFMKHWERMTQHSHKARLLWREITGRGLRKYSPTRWWSLWECQQQLLELFGDISTFLRACSDQGIAPKSLDKLLQLLLHSSKELMVELAVTVDAGEPFVKATYKLEGDGPLAIECYEILSSVKAAVQVCHLPNTVAISKRLATTALPEDHWMQYAKACIKPGYDYFEAKFGQELCAVVDAFKAARIFHPAKVNFLKPDCSTIDTLRSLKLLDNDQVLDGLKSELPTYLAISEDTADDIDLLVWWEQHAEKIPSWANACKKIILCQPSSACVERVFSLLKQFNEQQQSALEDYIETALMMQYNN